MQVTNKRLFLLQGIKRNSLDSVFFQKEVDERQQVMMNPDFRKKDPPIDFKLEENALNSILELRKILSSRNPETKDEPNQRKKQTEKSQSNQQDIQC